MTSAERAHAPSQDLRERIEAVKRMIYTKAKAELWRRYKAGVEYVIESSTEATPRLKKALRKACRMAFERALARAKDGRAPRRPPYRLWSRAARTVPGPMLSDRWGYVVESPANYGLSRATWELKRIARQELEQ